MVPVFLHLLSILSLVVAFVIAFVIALDELRFPQRMWIMNIVWPVSALFGSLFAAFGYFRFGRLSSRRSNTAGRKGKIRANEKQPSFPVMVAKGATHCGSGCTLGDIGAEWLAFFFPAILVWLGWHTLFFEKVYAVWVLDFAFAFLIGIAFQYWTIKPMRHLSFKQGLAAAVKADFLSLTAWQLGMYGFMAFAQFILFRKIIGSRLEPTMPEFWFMMQIAMIAGFLTSYPVNWWLLARGIKEKM